MQDWSETRFLVDLGPTGLNRLQNKDGASVPRTRLRILEKESTFVEQYITVIWRGGGNPSLCKSDTATLYF